ncbi:MAG: hypothetical protein K9W45_11245 [Candidatus Heimdallarchaeum aukensis]|uniref:Uncharacterized protein n=1 Tax=Candidatus Heimdallarchaeum aukensis TaxID=2876573 RepID=A0A9Y1BJY0_9ARCH|nr:MAG: hypothetical protein K9W45_11245 [Candidatus Heimdallarchaeum aukensis]
MKMFIPPQIYNPLKFILEDTEFSRTDDIKQSNCILITYSLIEDYKKEITSNRIGIIIALSKIDIEHFCKTIKSCEVTLDSIKFENQREILKVGNVGIEAKDKTIKFQKHIIAIIRDNFIYCLPYFTEYHRKLETELIKNIFKEIFKNITVSEAAFPKFSKRVWDGIQRSLTFLMSFGESISLSDFYRLAEIDEISEWMEIFIEKGILEIKDEKIGCATDFNDRLHQLRLKWPELDNKLKECEDNG